MAAEISEPRVMECGAHHVVGTYAVFAGDDEGPAWAAAFNELERRKHEITNRVGDTIIAFLYRPHRDDPSVAPSVRSCFIGVEAADFEHVPAGMTGTHFAAGRYVAVTCQSPTQDETSAAIGEAVEMLEQWIRDNGYRESDACLCIGHEQAAGPPFVEEVHIRFEPVR